VTTTKNIPDYYLITEAEDLEDLARALQSEAVIAVDTESNSLYAYHERVCLLQFSTLEADYLVDPLALEDLSPLAPLFKDAAVEKVFHAAEYDLLCIKRDFEFECVHLFDTMLAARILGRHEFGLGAMLETEFGVHLDKRQQRANWGERPLPQHLLDYARLDTHYLIALRNRLEAELQERGLWELAQEDFARLCALSAPENGRNGTNARTPDCWRISGSHDLTPQQAAVLQELCRYRDQVARYLDRPLFKVLNDHTLLAIAATAPRNLEELSQLPGMSPAQVRRHGRQLLQMVQQGLKAEPLYPPRAVRPDDNYLRRLEALRNWRKRLATRLRVPSDVVLPRELMLALADGGPSTFEQLSVILRHSPWRLQHFGQQILDAIRPWAKDKA
jgi:ribonuclease D